MSDVHTASELEDEQEVDLSSVWQRLKVRWWLPIGGLLVGVVIGIALAVSGGSVWRAQTIVYLGQPFAPLGSSGGSPRSWRSRSGDQVPPESSRGPTSSPSTSSSASLSTSPRRRRC